MNKETKHFLLKNLFISIIILGITSVLYILRDVFGLSFRIRFPLWFNLGSFILIQILFYSYSRKKIAATPLKDIKSNLKHSLIFGFTALLCFISFGQILQLRQM